MIEVFLGGPTAKPGGCRVDPLTPLRHLQCSEAYRVQASRRAPSALKFNEVN